MEVGDVSHAAALKPAHSNGCLVCSSEALGQSYPQSAVANDGGRFAQATLCGKPSVIVTDWGGYPLTIFGTACDLCDLYDLWLAQHFWRGVSTWATPVQGQECLNTQLRITIGVPRAPETGLEWDRTRHGEDNRDFSTLPYPDLTSYLF